MDYERPGLVEVEPDDLEEVPRRIRPDSEDTWWIRVGVKVNEDDRMVERMQDRDVVDAVLASRTVALHTQIS